MCIFVLFMRNSCSSFNPLVSISFSYHKACISSFHYDVLNILMWAYIGLQPHLSFNFHFVSYNVLFPWINHMDRWQIVYSFYLFPNRLSFLDVWLTCSLFFSTQCPNRKTTALDFKRLATWFPWNYHLHAAALQRNPSWTVLLDLPKSLASSNYPRWAFCN